jgi:hypothetical protein
MVSHTVARCSDEHPTDGQLKELFAQIERGKVTKSRLQEFLHGESEVVPAYYAKEILGENNFFGPEEWRKYFGGDRFPIRFIPPIPWTIEELEYHSGITDDHFLFLRPQQLTMCTLI